MPRKSNLFRLAVGLWVSPDFSLVKSGHAKPPRVNHLNLDYLALRDALKAAFSYGPEVNISVPNDTIDQVTLHTRAGMLGTQAPDLKSAQCCDFGEAMLRCESKEHVIDVRNAWNPLHAIYVRDRSFAPPPVLIPFLVKAADFEDAMIWSASCRPVLGLSPFDPIKAILGEDRDDVEGSLPADLHEKLNDIFGSPFENSAVLARLAMDELPKEYGNLPRET